ncbi:MAG TPA: helix-turn-helix transcriptional regulator [Actinophytocola sp.]|uniref:helix-turn-helix domain-containing protein n=1 Tax=Actinophytocola sp. TaxID=1872138 RepID=UPI002E03212C|nr:helix-turn-helix transcriptional regulator [Actinophytocola sp.]
MSQDADWPVNPTVRLRQLTETLRQLRERSGLTLEEAAEKLSAMGGRRSRSKLSRIENREQGVKDFDAERLLDTYEVTEPSSRNGSSAWSRGCASVATGRRSATTCRRTSTSCSASRTRCSPSASSR